MDNNFNKSLLGLNIKHLRKQKKLTQLALSHIIGIKTTTLSNWEVGLSSPDLDYIVKISNYFGISLDDIVLLPSDEWNGVKEVIRPECVLCKQKDITISALKETVAVYKGMYRKNSENDSTRQTG